MLGKNPGPGSAHHLAVEVFNVGGWLTHGDLALDAGLDFLAVTEHRLIPARVRSEWARLRAKGVASVWALASQDASHVGWCCQLERRPLDFAYLCYCSFQGIL